MPKRGEQHLVSCNTLAILVTDETGAQPMEKTGRLEAGDCGSFNCLSTICPRIQAGAGRGVRVRTSDKGAFEVYTCPSATG